MSTLFLLDRYMMEVEIDELLTLCSGFGEDLVFTALLFSLVPLVDLNLCFS